MNYGISGNYGAQNAASAQNTAQPPTVATHLQVIYEDVSELANRLGNIADRVIGSQPKGVEVSAKDPGTPTLHGMASGIKRALSELRSEVNRIDSAV